MYDLDNYKEYSFEEIVLLEQEEFFKIVLASLGLYNFDNVYKYINNNLNLNKIEKFNLDKLMDNQLKYFLEKGLLKNWEEYFSYSIQNRLYEGKEIDIEFFKSTYNILNMSIQTNTCYSFEQEYVI